MIPRQGLYAYGLVSHCPASLDMPGIDRQQRVYPIEGEDLCVIVSAIDVEAFQAQVKSVFSNLLQNGTTAASGTEDLLQAHEHVIETLMQDVPVVPFKFGTILKDETAVMTLLRDEGPHFQELLAKFVGREEWGVKVYADVQQFTHYALQRDEGVRALEARRAKVSKGAAYLLGRKIDEEIKSLVGAQVTSIAEQIFQMLGENAHEAKLSKTLPQKMTQKKHEMVLNAVYLLAKEQVAHFYEQGKSMAEAHAAMGVELEISGPWPPYSFV